jgi:hypothetical protein
MVMAGVLTVILATFKWTIIPDLKRLDQLPQLLIICGLVLFIAVLMFTTAIAMRLQVPLGRQLGLLTAAILILIFLPAGVYIWWFLHTDGAKRMYGVDSE